MCFPTYVQGSQGSSYDSWRESDILFLPLALLYNASFFKMLLLPVFLSVQEKVLEYLFTYSCKIYSNLDKRFVGLSGFNSAPCSKFFFPEQYLAVWFSDWFCGEYLKIILNIITHTIRFILFVIRARYILSHSFTWEMSTPMNS